MEPFLEKVPILIDQSFFVKREPKPFLDWGWHFHPEFEICLTEKSTGKRFVGTNIENFQEGDLVLLGSMLPHAFENDPIYKEGRNDLFAQTLVVQFKMEIFGESLLKLPEMNNVLKLLEKSKFGIEVYGTTRKVIEKELANLVELAGAEKLLKLLEILVYLSKSAETRSIVKGNYSKSFRSSDSGRINVVYNYIVDNFHSDIRIKDVAELANLTESSFCKYFKQRTSKPFSLFLNEIRIKHSCKLLIENNDSINQICQKSGFNNLSNFNKQFKKIIGKTPREYQNEHNHSLL